MGLQEFKKAVGSIYKKDQPKENKVQTVQKAVAKTQGNRTPKQTSKYSAVNKAREAIKEKLKQAERIKVKFKKQQKKDDYQKQLEYVKTTTPQQREIDDQVINTSLSRANSMLQKQNRLGGLDKEGVKYFKEIGKQEKPPTVIDKTKVATKGLLEKAREAMKKNTAYLGKEGISKTLKEIPQATADVLYKKPGKVVKAFTYDPIVSAGVRSYVTAKGKKEYVPKNELEKFVMGSKAPIRNIKGYGEETAAAFGASKKNISPSAALLLGAGITTLDFIPGAGNKVSDIGKALSKTSKIDDVKNVLSVAKNINIPENKLDDVARIIAKETNAKKIDNMLQSFSAKKGLLQLAKEKKATKDLIKNESKGLKIKPKDDVIKAQEMYRDAVGKALDKVDSSLLYKRKGILIDDLVELEELKRKVELGKDTTQDVMEAIPTLKRVGIDIDEITDLKPLSEQALNYGSVDDFVKAKEYAAKPSELIEIFRKAHGYNDKFGITKMTMGTKSLYGGAPGALAGIERDEETGKLKYNPTKGALGMAAGIAGMGLTKKVGGKKGILQTVKENKRINDYLKNAYKVYAGDKPYKLVAQLSDDVVKNTNLPKDVVVKKAFFEKMSERHPEIKKDKLFQFVRTLNIPDEVYQLPVKDKLNFFRKVENDFTNIVGTRLDEKASRVTTSFLTDSHNYTRNIKKTAKAVSVEPTEGALGPSSLIQSPPAGELSSREISGVSSSTTNILRKGDDVNFKEGILQKARREKLEREAKTEVLLPQNKQGLSEYKKSDLGAEGVRPSTSQAGQLLEAKGTGAKKQIEQGLSYNKKLSQKGSMVNFNAKDYVKSQVAKREMARRIEKGGVLSRLRDFKNLVKRKLVDSNAPIEDAIREAQKKGRFELLPKYDITNQIDRVLRAPTLAGQFMREHGLEKVIKSVDSLDNLEQYMIAKHAKTLETNGIKTGRNLDMDSRLVEAFKGKYEPYAKEVTAYSRKMLDYAEETGLISKKVADGLKVKYPDYVPMQRVFSELENPSVPVGRKGVASLGRQSVVQSIKGSEREIESPINSLLEKTNDLFTQGEKNKAGKILANVLPENLMREVETGTGVYTISYLENGVKRTFETTKEISEAAKSLNTQQLNILGKILAAPVRLARIGITGINLPFTMANVAKDQVTAFVNSSKPLRTSVANPVVFLKSLYTAIGHGKLYDEMAKAGALGTSFDIARSQVPQTVAKIRAGRNIGTKIAYTVRHPGELFRAVENIVSRSEELTRIQQYAGTKGAALKTGRTAEDATILGARAARENTVNFMRKGEWGTVLNSAFLYLNAGIQGSRTFVRTMKKNPVGATAKIATAVFTPLAIATSWNLNDPKRKEAYDDIPDYEKSNNIIIIPPNPTKDDKGNWNVIKIPISQEFNNLARPVRRFVEESKGYDSVKFGEIAGALIGSVSPINLERGAVVSTLTPQFIRPTLEATVNKNLFTGIPQVPDKMKYWQPSEQVKDWTSGSARKIGKVLNISPIKVEEFLKGTGGGVASQLLNVSDRMLAKIGAIPPEQIGGQDIKEAILSRFTKARGGVEENKKYDILDEVKKFPKGSKEQKELIQNHLNGLSEEDRESVKAMLMFNGIDTKGITTSGAVIKGKPIYENIQKILKEQGEDTALEKLDELTDEEYDAYNAAKKSIKAQQTNELKKTDHPEMEATVMKVQELVANDQEEQAYDLIDTLTDEEYETYKVTKKQLIEKRAQELEITAKKVMDMVKEERFDEAHEIVDNMTDLDYEAYQQAKKNIFLNAPEYEEVMKDVEAKEKPLLQKLWDKFIPEASASEDIPRSPAPKAVDTYSGKAECVGFARQYKPDLPTGLWTYGDKLDIINSDDPDEGSVAVINTNDNTGHVAVVAKVNSNGTVTITEANYRKSYGTPLVTTRTDTPERLGIVGYYN